MRLDHFILGKFVAGKNELKLHDVNPSDKTDAIAEAPEATQDEIDDAVSAASGAFSAWRSIPAVARAEMLYRWADVLSSRLEEIAQVICREVGKPISEARGEAARGVAILRYYAGEAVHPSGDLIPSQSEGALQFTIREPLGVVALITPWNFPIAIPLWKMAPTLAFGNTAVWKPSEMSPYVSTLLAQTAASAGLPPGVLNLVLGSGDRAGNGLLHASGVNAVSFTGSLRIGAHVAAVAAERGLRYQTEMGGKNAAIVLKDCDLDRAASLTAGGAMRFAGQKCTATSRVIVAKEIAAPFREKLEQAIRALPIGPVDDSRAAVGPLISEAALNRIEQVRAGLAAACVFEASLPEDDRFARGFFSAPTVVYGAETDSVVATAELFGPILTVFESEDLDHAIEMANLTPFGLSATLFTSNLHEVLKYIDKIQAGMVRVNGDTTGVDPHAPFGGMKASSSGSREQGPAAREFYTQIKTVEVRV